VIESEWDRVKGWVQQALDEGGNTYSLGDIRAAVESDQMALVAFPHFAVLLAIIVYPQLKALRVVGVGGDLNKALPDYTRYAMTLPELAKQLGCKRLEAMGRPGWVRAMKDIEMTSHAFMFKEV
jgi:hypothetical protein